MHIHCTYWKFMPTTHNLSGLLAVALPTSLKSKQITAHPWCNGALSVMGSYLLTDCHIPLPDYLGSRFNEVLLLDMESRTVSSEQRVGSKRAAFQMTRISWNVIWEISITNGRGKGFFGFFKRRGIWHWNWNVCLRLEQMSCFSVSKESSEVQFSTSHPVTGLS